MDEAKTTGLMRPASRDLEIWALLFLPCSATVVGVDELALALLLPPVADGVVFKDDAVLLLAEDVDWVELFKFVGVVAFGFWPEGCSLAGGGAC